MKIVMTLLVRDEQDVLRENLEFHLAHGVDSFVLMDNLSVDGTAAIAREYARAGVLRYVFQPRDDYSQGRWVTDMARRAYTELGADWVINADADEFWSPQGGSLEDVLAAVPPGVRAVSAERVNFVAREPNGEPFWRRMTVRCVTSRNVLGYPLEPKVAHRADPDVVVAQGNHSVAFGDEPARCAPAPITILHFPVRTQAQFANKIAKGGAAYERNTELDPGMGRTWRALYQKFLAGTLGEVFAHELHTEEQVARGLGAGALVQDERLISTLSARIPGLAR